MIHPKKVGHVVLKVRDLKRAEQFYTEVLGMEVVMRLDRPQGIKGVFFSLGEQHHDIAVLEVPTDAELVKDNQVGLHHIALQVGSFAELQDAYRTLKARGANITRTIDHFITKSIYFTDPDGNGLELYCDVGEDGLERIKRGEAAAFAPLQLEA
jgi:catechol 2,3-dioxygenase